MADENAKNNTIRNLLIIIAVILAIGVGYFIFDKVMDKRQADCLREAIEKKTSCQKASFNASYCGIYDHEIKKCYE